MTQNIFFFAKVHTFRFYIIHKISILKKDLYKAQNSYDALHNREERGGGGSGEAGGGGWSHRTGEVRGSKGRGPS